MTLRTSKAFLFLLLLAAVQTPLKAHHVPIPDGMSEAEATWLWGYYTVPATITRDRTPYWYGYTHTDSERINDPEWTDVATQHITAGAKAPAVLVMHGCAGIIRSPTAYRLFFLERGYAIFEPDSFARPGHSCNFKKSFDKRNEELGYAFKRIQQLPWVDHERIVLMGLSEGGRAVAFWEKPGFAAHIITMANCNRGSPRAPAGTPVLAIVGGEDDLLSGTHCNVTRTINGSKSIVIPGARHGIMGHRETTEAIETFLDESSL